MTHLAALLLLPPQMLLPAQGPAWDSECGQCDLDYEELRQLVLPSLAQLLTLLLLLLLCLLSFDAAPTYQTH
jgi:hypothetical protein